MTLMLITQVQASAEPDANAMKFTKDGGQITEVFAEDFIETAFGGLDSLLKLNKPSLVYRFDYELSWPYPLWTDDGTVDENEYGHLFVENFLAEYSEYLTKITTEIKQITGVEIVRDQSFQQPAEVRITLTERRINPRGRRIWRTWYSDKISVGRRSSRTFGYQFSCVGLTERSQPPPLGSWNVSACEARVEGWVVTGRPDQTVRSYCRVVANFERELVKSQLLECLVRSLGIMGVSELFVSSVFGERLPFRPDYFLNGGEDEEREIYASRIPTELTPVGNFYLSVLFDPRLVTDMRREDAASAVREILRSRSDELLELRGWGG